MKETRAAENKPAWISMHQYEIEHDDRNIGTYEYEDTIHALFQRLDMGFVVALCFFLVEGP